MSENRLSKRVYRRDLDKLSQRRREGMGCWKRVLLSQMLPAR